MNIFEDSVIHSDNLTFLSHLQESYQEHLQVVCIDPPYFKVATVYYRQKDKLEAYLLFLKLRLVILHQLLREDGSFFCFINDKASHYVKVLCDSIFGMDNFIGSIIWERGGWINNARGVANNHDVILFYAKNKQKLFFNRCYQTSKKKTFQTLVNSRLNKGHFYTLSHEGKIYLSPHKGWLLSENLVKQRLKEGRIVPYQHGLRQKYPENPQSCFPSVWRADTKELTQGYASRELSKDFPGFPHFFPKPLEIVKRILRIATRPDSLILDCFAGSGTTGVATLALNAEDQGNRQFILIEEQAYAKDLCFRRLQKFLEGETLENNVQFLVDNPEN